MQNAMVHAERAALSLALACAFMACSADPPATRPNGGTAATGAGSGGFGSFTGAAGTGFQNPNPAASSGGGAGIAGAGVAGTGTPGEECAQARVNVSRNTPVILFVVDGSGSMCESFGGSTRWQSLRTALLDPTIGLIHRLQATAEFGLVLYDGTIDLVLALSAIGGSPPAQCAGMYTEMKQMGECPGLIQVPTAPLNAAAIDMAFPMTELGGSTPTDKAMKVAVDQLIAAQSNSPDSVIKPQYIILATDGQPNDICVGGVGGDGMLQKTNVIAEVDRASAANITTFVVSLAGGDMGLQQHLDEVARHGDPDNMMARTYSPETPEDLVAALAALVGGAVGCDVFLNGSVTAGQECRGSVKLNDMELPCCQGTNCGGVASDPQNGWVLKDPSTISLVGETCTNFLVLAEASLYAGFPCDVFVVD
jgi:hypothetical protein